jgi:hypothetical protein
MRALLRFGAYLQGMIGEVQGSGGWLLLSESIAGLAHGRLIKAAMMMIGWGSKGL